MEHILVNLKLPEFILTRLACLITIAISININKNIPRKQPHFI